MKQVFLAVRAVQVALHLPAVQPVELASPSTFFSHVYMHKTQCKRKCKPLSRLSKLWVGHKESTYSVVYGWELPQSQVRHSHDAFLY